MSAQDRYVELVAGLTGQSGFRLHRDPGDPVDPPAAVLLAPSLTWLTASPAPSEGVFQVAAVVAADDRALVNAMTLVELVAAVVDALPGFVVRSADPDRYVSGGSDLPCYLINIEVSL